MNEQIKTEVEATILSLLKRAKNIAEMEISYSPASDDVLKVVQSAAELIKLTQQSTH